MNNETKNKLVPKLRFKEFQENFYTDELKNLVEEDRKIRYGIVQPGKYEVSGRLMIRGQDYSNGWANPKEVFRVSEEVESRYKKARVREGDLLMTIVGFTGLVECVPKEFDGANITQTTARIAIDHKIAVPNYVRYFLESNAGRSIIDRYTKGLAQPGLNIGDVEIFKIILTCYEEQQKIADCLSSLDEFITAQNQKLEALKAHKKGLMQQLFPAEGESVPQRRFEEFRDSGEWEEKILSELAHYENGKAHEQDIVEDGKYIVVNSKFISSDGEVKKYTNTAFCLAAKKDILMVLSDVPNGKAIAKCFFVATDNLYSVNQRICKITAFDANSLMLFYVLNRNSYFLSFDDGVKQTNLKNDDVLGFPFLLPKDVEEQQKIADCLSSLDELITAQTKKIEELKRHKKGLMQGLFPKTTN